MCYSWCTKKSRCCEMVEPDVEVSVSVLALVHKDISLLQDGRT